MNSLTIAQRLGADPTGEVVKPVINLNKPLSELAEAVVQHLPVEQPALFLKGENFVTVNVRTVTDRLGNKFAVARETLMTVNRFRTWIERFMLFSTGSEDKEKICSLSKQTAEAILTSDILEKRTPVIRELCPVRLPIWTRDADGRPAIQLAEPGYNPDTGYYTVETIKYSTQHPEKFTPGAIRKIWNNIVGLFPWKDQNPIQQNRDIAISAAILMGQFCRNLVAKLPMIIINGNQPGTGKSLLAWLLIAPVHGIPPSTLFPTDENELGKTLNSMALEGAPFIMLDDIGSLLSRAINNFATSPTIKGRILGGNKTFTVENNCQLLATGNGLSTTPDIERRSLILDLHYSGDAKTRRFAHVLQKESFNGVQWRADMLSLCWYILNNWIADGYKKYCGRSDMPSFEDFAETVGSIVMANGFASPFLPRDGSGMGGDLLGRTVIALIKACASRILPEYMSMPHTNLAHTYKVGEILDISDELGYTETITSTKDKNKSLGRRLTPYRDREFTDDLGRRFAFGRGETAGSSFYTFVILSEPQNQQQDNQQ